MFVLSNVDYCCAGGLQLLQVLFDGVSRIRDVVDPAIDHLLFVLQQGREISERPVGRKWLLRAARRRPVTPLRIQIPRVLIVVTVETQQFPVVAIRRIVIVVVILVMNCQLAKSLAREFAPAPRTYPRKNPERSLPIGLCPTLSFAPHLVNTLIQPIGLCSRLLWCHVRTLQWSCLEHE